MVSGITRTRMADSPDRTSQMCLTHPVVGWSSVVGPTRKRLTAVIPDDRRLASPPESGAIRLAKMDKGCTGNPEYRAVPGRDPALLDVDVCIGPTWSHGATAICFPSHRRGQALFRLARRSWRRTHNPTRRSNVYPVRGWAVDQPTRSLSTTHGNRRAWRYVRVGRRRGTSRVAVFVCSESNLSKRHGGVSPGPVSAESGDAPPLMPS
jgi:hypothetical protein